MCSFQHTVRSWFKRSDEKCENYAGRSNATSSGMSLITLGKVGPSCMSMPLRQEQRRRWNGIGSFPASQGTVRCERLAAGVPKTNSDELLGRTWLLVIDNMAPRAMVYGVPLRLGLPHLCRNSALPGSTQLNYPSTPEAAIRADIHSCSHR